jgi:glycosyltransferase involved in cell wall biosynthesis
MRILLVSSRFWPYIGGVEEMTGGLARELSKRGHTVKVISARTSLAEKQREQIRGVDIARVFLVFFGISPKQSLTTPFLAPIGLTAFMREIHYFNPDLINAHFIDGNAFYLNYARRFKKIPLVVTLHGSDVKVFPKRSKIHGSLFSSTLKLADRVVFTSRNLSTHLPDNLTLDESKTRVVHNGVDIKKLRAEITTPDIEIASPYFFSAGRFVDIKGFDILIEAFGRIANSLPEHKLVIAGDGPTRAAIAERAKQLGIEERVVLPGMLPHGQALALLQSAQIALLPSREENFSIFALEAAALGTPLIASDTGGLPELISDGDNGITVKVGEVTELAAAIKKLAGDRKLREKIARNAQVNAEQNYTLDSYTERMLEVYREVVKRP